MQHLWMQGIAGEAEPMLRAAIKLGRANPSLPAHHTPFLLAMLAHILTTPVAGTKVREGVIADYRC